MIFFWRVIDNMVPDDSEQMLKANAKSVVVAEDWTAEVIGVVALAPPCIA